MHEEIINLPESYKEDNTPILSSGGVIKIFKNEMSKLISEIQLDEIEPISNQTFQTLIQESFSQNKGFIIGRM
jgi:hypothetical protein